MNTVDLTGINQLSAKRKQRHSWVFSFLLVALFIGFVKLVCMAAEVL